jgi:hypothetical protein
LLFLIPSVFKWFVIARWLLAVVTIVATGATSYSVIDMLWLFPAALVLAARFGNRLALVLTTRFSAKLVLALIASTL